MHKIAHRLAVNMAALLILTAPFVVVYNSKTVQAADLDNRSVRLASSEVSVTTSHEVRFDYVTSANIGSIQIEYCTNTPLFGLSCTAPTGLSLDAAVLSSETGVTGYSIHPNSTTNKLILSRTSSLITPVSARYLISNIDNPSIVGTHYVRLASFSSTDGTGTRIDEGGVAISTTRPIDVTTYVPPVLIFCLGTSIPTNDCSSAVGNDIDFGILDENSTAQATTQMLVATNGVGGYSVSMNGTTMTSGNNVIVGNTTPTASSIGTSQFGVNLVDNSNPNVGANISGNGSGYAASGYDIANRFKFVDGDTVARSDVSSDINRYTMSYIVNVSDDQPPGVYSTTLTFIALATF